ncbi:YraN family protein [uncultured Paracoccus sp.]|uniref:YraN family protein n=1 Tax=uncultured Paracoccus sp. TaxID=189685 RepID=UPI002604484E|nr:YraN family protein [uncultured Paracoccus sp.]
MAGRTGMQIGNDARQSRGRIACLSGRMAEDGVALHYEAAGYALLERRWRGPAGEIDLIFRDSEGLIFVEVKKSSSHDLAAQRLDRRQMDRICLSALDYAGRVDGGRPVAMRFDAALVDEIGRIDVIENAFGMN